MRKPKISIQNFAGMGDDGIYFAHSMSAKKYNGQTVLTGAHRSANWRNSDDTGFSTLIQAINDYTAIRQNGVNLPNVVGISGGYLYHIDNASSGNSRGQIHQVYTGENSLASTRPAVFSTVTNNHLIYINSARVGAGFKLLASSANSTSITFAASVDLTSATYGFTATPTAGANKAYNLTRGEEYTITSIDDNGGTKNRINFSTAGTTPQASDEIYIFNDERYSLGYTASATNVHFKGQEAPTNWFRQAVLWGDEFWMLNGNYLATLNIDETTFSATAKQLDYGCQGTCLAANQDLLAIGCEVNGAGRLLVYDGASNIYVNKIDLPHVPTNIVPYGGAWLVSAGDTVFYFNGSQMQKVFSLPDSGWSSVDIAANSLKTLHDKIYVAVTSNPGVADRRRGGYYVYEPESGLTWLPTHISGLRFSETGGPIFMCSYWGGVPAIYSSAVDTSSSKVYISRIYDDTPTVYGVQMYIKLPQKMKLGEIELCLQGQPGGDVIADDYASSTVSVNFGDGRSKFMRYAQYEVTGSDSNTIVNAIGQYYPVKDGDMIEFKDGAAGGERSFITSISNVGEATETWEISPSLTATPTDGSYIRTYALRSAGSKSIDPLDVDSTLYFTLSDFYGDKLWLDIQISAAGSGNQLDITGINIY